MGLPAVTGASIVCTMGLAPGVLNATSQSALIIEGKPVAVIRDTAPMINVGACGMCTSMANPAVSAATAAALGVLTPQPCIPAPAGMWLGGGTLIAGGLPCLTMESTLVCTYGGSITIKSAGQTKMKI